MDIMEQNLLKQGWHLTKEGLDLCYKKLSQDGKRNPSQKDIVNCALNFDLSEIGEKTLPDDVVKGKAIEFSGPCVLQIVKIRNASAPKVNEESTVAPRMLQIHLSDGHKTCVGVEHESLKNQISINSPPGSKVCLNGTIKLRNGFLLLHSKNIAYLEGEVEVLYNKWKAAKDAGGFHRNVASNDEMPPPFVPFGKKIVYQCNTSQSTLNNANHNADEDGDQEFNQQRESAIAEVKKNMSDTTKKVFASGRNKPSTSSEQHEPDKKTENHRDIKHYERIWREKDSFSKSNNAKVDESKCEKLIQMGFQRNSAIKALQDCNNNVDSAVEVLLKQSDGSNSNRNFSQQPRRDSYRDRAARRGGRRGGGRFADEEQESSQSTGVTLFDYVENKMTASGSKQKKKRNNNTPSTSKAQEKAVSVVDDDAFQEECIIEYVKELSLVETRGSTDADDGVQRSEPGTSGTKSENSGVMKYRSGGSYSGPKNSREKEDGWSRPSDHHFQSNQDNTAQGDMYRFYPAEGSNVTNRRGNSRSENFNSKRYNQNRSRDKPASQESNLVEQSFYQDEEYQPGSKQSDRKRESAPQTGQFDQRWGSEPERGQHNRKGNNQRRKRQVDRRHVNDPPSPNDSWENQPEADYKRRGGPRSNDFKRSQDFQPQSDQQWNEPPAEQFGHGRSDQSEQHFERKLYDDQNDHRYASRNTPHYSKESEFRDGHYSNRPHRNDAHHRPPKHIPPRFLKKQAREGGYSDNEQTGDHSARKSLTLGDTAQQMKLERSRSPHDPTSNYARNDLSDRQRPPASHSYQDQRQQNRSTTGRMHEVSEHYRDADESDEICDWAPGMMCQAKYWEDDQVQVVGRFRLENSTLATVES